MSRDNWRCRSSYPLTTPLVQLLPLGFQLLPQVVVGLRLSAAGGWRACRHDGGRRLVKGQRGDEERPQP